MKWIVFEGVDGAGKSTLLDLVSDKLFERGWDVPQPTREPGGFGVDPVLRRLALREKEVVARQLLMAADARVNFNLNVRPYLEYPEGAEDTIVLQDRGAWSAAVYSGMEDPLVESLGHGGTKPHAYVLVTASTEVCLRRLAERQGEPDQFDLAGAATLARRQRHYQQLAGASLVPVLTVDGGGSDPAVPAAQVVRWIEALMAR